MLTDSQYRQAVKGNCYLATYLLFEVLQGNPKTARSERRLCHGVVVQTRPPHVEMGHAWLEECHSMAEVFPLVGKPNALLPTVRDVLFPHCPLPRVRYYEVGKVREHTVQRYTLEEAKRLLDETKSYDPWDPVVAAAAHADDEE